jgi:hypothetical protein
MMFEESAHLVPQLSEDVTFGPYEDILEDWQHRPSNLHEKPQRALGIILWKFGRLDPHIFRITQMVPWFAILLQPDPK